MNAKDYVSFSTAVMLKTEGFDGKCHKVWVKTSGGEELMDGVNFVEGEIVVDRESVDKAAKYMMNIYDVVDNKVEGYLAPSLWDAMTWLKDVHHMLIVVDYEYECTNKSYYYKVYKLGENGKPERIKITGTNYDEFGNQYEVTLGYRDFVRSYNDYTSYNEALEDGICYCLVRL